MSHDQRTAGTFEKGREKDTWREGGQDSHSLCWQRLRRESLHNSTGVRVKRGCVCFVTQCSPVTSEQRGGGQYAGFLTVIYYRLPSNANHLNYWASYYTDCDARRIMWQVKKTWVNQTKHFLIIAVHFSHWRYQPTAQAFFPKQTLLSSPFSSVRH